MAEEPLKAEFFVTRNDGKMVPLIAVDELPHHIIIAGVSRVMSPFDIAGMTCVGRSGFRHRQHIVQEADGLAATNNSRGLDPLKAKYFITRDSGNMVPLVSMDEMPEHFAVEGVLRVLSPFDISGMTCVGLSDARERIHHVEDVKNAPLSYFTREPSVDDEVTESDDIPETPTLSVVGISNAESTAPIIMTPESSAAAHTSSTADSKNQSVERIAPGVLEKDPVADGAVDNTTEDRATSVPNHNAAAGNGKLVRGVKEYCSYWIRHGECDYQQQGCLYKHEMPLDQETLHHLGLRDIPRWYREKHSLGSFLAAGGSGAAFGGQGLKSTVAIGELDEEKRVKLENNWRNGAQNNNTNRPMMDSRRGNTYNPRASRMTTSSRPPTCAPLINRQRQEPHPLTYGKLRSNETLAGRQHFEALQALKSYEKVDEYMRAGGPLFNLGSQTWGSSDFHRGRRRDRSVSTMTTDVEGTITRRDDERKAKEDAHYAEICKAEKRKQAGNEDKDVKPKTEGGVAEKRSSKEKRRGGKSGGGRGRYIKPSERLNNAA